MKCKNCGIENTNDAKFCRGCGQDLSIKENPMDKWPDYGFQPTSLISLKQYRKGRAFFFKLFRLVCLLFGLWSLYVCFVCFVNGNAYSFAVITIIAFIVSLLITIVLYRGFPKKRHESILKKDVDYIQGTSFASKTYLFFIKDNHWGVYNMKNYSIQIPAAYDFLEWREYGRLLNGKKDNRSIIIDINGQELK